MKQSYDIDGKKLLLWEEFGLLRYSIQRQLRKEFGGQWLERLFDKLAPFRAVRLTLQWKAEREPAL